ncbi:MAG: DUF1570 domain-containing protein [Planctomycetota bacterium]
MKIELTRSRTERPASEGIGTHRIRATGRYIFYIVILIGIFISGINISQSDEINQWKECKVKVLSEIQKYQYLKAISLLENFIKTVKDEELQKDINGYIEDINGEMTLFKKMIMSLTDDSNQKKIVINDRKILITKADEVGIEGNGDSVTCTKRWVDIPPQSILDLFPPSSDLIALEGFYLGIWCYNHNLLTEGEQKLILWLNANSDEKWRLDRFLCRYRNIPLPPGGFVEYQRRLVTPEEKSYIEKGLVNYNGKWVTYDEMMKSKGLVKCMGRWVTPAEKAKLEPEIKATEEIRKKYPPKGVLDKKGADAEGLPWEKARTKKTDHYIIKTNLSADALDDLCFLMECFHFKAQQIFKLKIKVAPLEIDVFRTAEEYYKHGGSRDSGGHSESGGGEFPLIKTFYHAAQPDSSYITSETLMHEGTHPFVHLACGSYESEVPTWISEGLAAYSESNKFDGNALQTNLVSNYYLKLIKELITDKKVVHLADFIDITKNDFDVEQYAQAWSLVYFFINYNNGQYANLFDAYFTVIKKKGANLLADKKIHRKAFEESFKVTAEILEKQWKEYIMKLEPAPEDTDNK